ncbi:MAG: hypothetical protein LUG95_00980 [Clostridiales bacterium]|nr:hypothetical protein [Clostridiales bacterium]
MFAISNAASCYFVNGGKIFSIGYSSLLFNYLHFFLLSAIVVIVNMCFKLYRSVWTFAGVDEIVSCVVAAFVNTTMLFVVDKVLFKSILGANKILPFYAYLLCLIFMIFSACLPRIGAGYIGNTVIDDMKSNQSQKYIPIVAIDDNPAKYRKRINNIKIAGNCNDIPDVAKNTMLTKSLFAYRPQPKPVKTKYSTLPCKQARKLKFLRLLKIYLKTARVITNSRKLT